MQWQRGLQLAQKPLARGSGVGDEYVLVALQHMESPQEFGG